MAGIPVTLLSWIKTEVDYALKVVRDNIARFLAAPEDAAVLVGCPDQLHQVSGALRIVGLTGATRFCETIEGTFSGLNRGRPSRAAIGVIDHAVLELKEFVDDLARGQANAPLRLFPVYRELTTLQGKSDISEKDLFFPDLEQQAPPHPEPRVLAKDELPPYLQAQRARFERGLLAWLRNQPDGLKEMRLALDALHQVAPQLPEPRALWWVATGLIDGLQKTPDPDWLGSAKGLCNKLDFQMRDLTSRSKKDYEPLVRELLYAIAKCREPTPRIKEIRQYYQLDSLVPGPGAPGLMKFDMDWLQPALSDARSRLEALKGAWLQYVSGEPKSVARFRELVASFKSKAAELGNQQLVKLLDVITLVSTRLPDPYPGQGQFMVIEIASAFLLVESIIDSYTSPPADLEQQIVVMGGWLLDAAKGKSTGEPPAGLHVDLSQRIGALQLRAQVAREILANLRHVEQVLDAFARDPGKRDTLPGLKPYLRQIHGALAVLRFEHALEVLSLCDRMIGDCARADHTQTGRDMDWIAEGLSTLGFYLEPCLHGGEPTEQAIGLFFSRFEKRDAPAAEPVKDVITLIRVAAAASEQVATVAAPVTDARAAAAVTHESVAAAPESEMIETAAAPQSPVNEELLAIYLDEAGTVLASIDAALPMCREQPRDRDVLSTIRLGFHTLKGSGRMVGLANLGEIAWQVEQVMNQHLEQKRPATPELLELIEAASALFATAVAHLRTGEPLTIDARRITDLADRLKSGEEPAEAPAEVEGIEPVAPVAAPEAEEVTIGGRRLARSFFDIYLKEAAQHVAALESEYSEWCNVPDADASHELLRAAHTLASSSRTAGFSEIADLASAIEQWTPMARQVTEADDAEAVETAIGKLRQMVDAVASGQPPAPADESVHRLRDLTVRLQAQAAATPPLQSRAVAEAEAPVVAAPDVPAPALEPVPLLVGQELRKMRDDLDEQLLPIFLEEARELLPLIGSDLREWKANPRDEKVLQSLKRALHTLKGSARMAGAIRLGELTHLMETRVEEAARTERLPAELFEELESKMDRLSIDLDRMQEELAAPGIVGAEPAAAPQGVVPPEALPRAEPPLPGPSAMLRINADTLDHLINQSGEVSIARSRVEAELRAIKQSLADLNESLIRLRGQLREIELQADSQMQSRASMLDEANRDFDPLEFDRYTRLQELTRLMGESLHDATSVQQGLLKNVGETESALLQQSRTSRDVQQELMRMRAVPFSNLNERLYRIVRQVARELDKKAELFIEGSQVELDRGVLERIGAPIEHMLRNALAHGIERPALRAAAGKPEAGRITLTLRQESNEIALVLSDDGAGLNLESLRQKALDKGILPRDREATKADLVQLVFAGLSTAQAVTELSGRGVGMDVVRSVISSLGGRVDIDTESGAGTTFTVYLPLTLAVTQAVLVRAGRSVLAVSAAMVEQVLRFKSEDMAALYENKVVEARGRSNPLFSLSQLLGEGGRTEVQNYNSVLLVRSGVQHIALHVDELIGNQEIVVKNVGPQLSRVPGVAGATVLPDGRIALIVNPVQLAQRPARPAPAQPAAPEPTVTKPAMPVIMVVDDSLTVRKVTSRLLEREGYLVLTAKDGVDALEQMKDTLPDVMLVDIEMPRMDGFDLAKIVRRDPRTQAIPIIIISSRTAEKHRRQAAQIGVNAFLGKPYQEADLLEHVSKYLAARKPAVTLH